MTHLFPLGSLKHTVFENGNCLAYLEENGIQMTNDISNADIFLLRALTPNTPGQLDAWIKNNLAVSRPVLVWTHEPRFCTMEKKIINEGNCTIHIMNVYTRDVYFSNYTIYGRNVNQLLMPAKDVQFSPKPLAGLASYVQEKRQKLILNDLDLDLTVKRQRLLLAAYHAGIADIYGKGWPGQIAVAESRGQGWHSRKLEILKNYQFNLCMENTAFDYYCTEKIWDSIKSYCLPIYSGFNNRIYETFPDNSFVDYHKFRNKEELLLFVRNMSRQEYLERINRCISAFNQVFTTVDIKKEKRRSLDAIIDRVRNIVEA